MDNRTTKLGKLALSGGEWRAHDLRRTGGTLMGELGIRSDVIERCLNHIGASKLVKTYQHQELIAERGEAFRKLGERLALLARGESGKVVTGKFGIAA